MRPALRPGASKGTHPLAPYLALVPRNVGPDTTGILGNEHILSIEHSVDTAANTIATSSTATGGSGPPARVDSTNIRPTPRRPKSYLKTASAIIVTPTAGGVGSTSTPDTKSDVPKGPLAFYKTTVVPP